MKGGLSEVRRADGKSYGSSSATPPEELARSVGEAGDRERGTGGEGDSGASRRA